MLRHSLVVGNRSVGISLANSRATVERTVVQDTRPNANGVYDDGICAIKKTTLDVRDTLVDRSARAGFLFENSGGSVHRSLSRGNVFAIDLEQGANPVVGDDNQFVDNQINQITTGQGLEAPSIPPPPKLQ